MSQKNYLRMVIFLLIFAGFSFPLFSAEDNGPFTIGTITAEAGEIRSGYLHVPTKSDPGCEIPVTIINGAKKGKVLALVAGVHGYEYPPILALYRLKQKIDPTSLSGTLILTYVANPPGFKISGKYGHSSCKPAITTESGYLGKTDEISIKRNLEGILCGKRRKGRLCHGLSGRN